VLIVFNVDVLDDLVGVNAQRLLLAVHLFRKCSGGLNVTVVLEELKQKGLDEVSLLERRQIGKARRRDFSMEALLFSLPAVSIRSKTKRGAD
jgi:hypothetical protein